MGVQLHEPHPAPRLLVTRLEYRNRSLDSRTFEESEIRRVGGRCARLIWPTDMLFRFYEYTGWATKKVARLPFCTCRCVILSGVSMYTA